MTASSLRTASACAAIALFTGCGESAPLTPLMPSMVPNVVLPARHPDRAESQMMPRAASIKTLLYVSDAAANDVDVYDYSSGTVVGKLTGFNGPSGQCVSARGDVFIANFHGGTIVEYAHGGNKPIKTLTTGGYPIGCAVSPSGDLAVTNFYAKKGPGSVAIFKNVSGNPTAYSDPATCYYMWPAGYDDKGNLFVEGWYQQIGLCWLPAGGQTMSAASFDHQITFPGGVTWDGKFLALTDQEYEGFYQTAVDQAVISGSNGALSEVGVMPLNDKCRSYYADVAQPFVVGAKNTPVNKTRGTAVVGSDAWCATRFAHWSYSSGRFISALTAAPQEPSGASVSIAGAVGAPSARLGAVTRKEAPACGWLSPAARDGQPLIYVADGNEVLVFSENGENSNAAAIGCIDDGINGAYGLNVDRHGNLYVTNVSRYGGPHTVTRYRPGSVTPSATYLEDLTYPLYSVVDAQGNLWVSNSGGGKVVEFGRGSIVVERILQTIGNNEADGLDFDQQGNLYVAYRNNYSAGIEKFAPGSNRGQDLGILLQSPQGLIVAKNGDILVVETGEANRVDLYPAGKTTAKIELPVFQTPTELAITATQSELFVGSYASPSGIDYATSYPLRNTSAFSMKLDIPGGNTQGVAFSNGQSF